MNPFIFYEILNILSNCKQTTTREIANKLEIGQRSAIRYLDALEMCYVPIARKRGKNGGIYLEEKYKLKSAVLTTHQMNHLKTLLESNAEKESKEILTLLKLTSNNKQIDNV